MGRDMGFWVVRDGLPTYEWSPIATIHWDDDPIDRPAKHITKKQQEANARLIAAAPELLEALKTILGRYDPEWPAAALEPDGGCIECTSGATPNDKNTGLCPRHRAIEAIAKAEGTS